MTATLTRELASRAFAMTMGVDVTSSIIVTDALDVPEVALWVSIDPTEIRRRRAFDLGAIDDALLISLMHALPLDRPVPLGDLEPRTLYRVNENLLPPGVAEVTATHITRVLRPVLRLHGVVVVDDDWDRGLTDASRFANQCARMLVLTAPACDPIAQLEADEYSIGLVGVNETGDMSVLVAPRQPGEDFTAFEWDQWELVYGSSELLTPT